jgi:hypothetical protein
MFDALIQYQPFEFAATLHATVDIARDGAPLLHAELYASLTGPSPWHALGYVEFDFLGRHRIDVEATIGAADPVPPAAVTASELQGRLLAAFQRPDAWAALPPASGARLVSLGESRATAATTVVVHPLGSLTVRQRVLPLAKTLTRFGPATVEPVSFTLESVRVGPPAAANGTLADILDHFAPGQFEALTEDQRLARPAFEAMRSGAHIDTGHTGVPSDRPGGVAATTGYAEKIVDVDPQAGTRSAQPPGAAPPELPDDVVSQLVGAGAAARAGTRATGPEAFAGPPRGIVVRPERWTAAAVDTLAPLAGALSHAEAAEQHAGEVALLHEAA